MLESGRFWANTNPTTPSAPHFHALSVSLSLSLIERLRDVMPRIQSHDGDLAKQLRRAASSVPINLAEGNRRTGKDRRYLFTVAAGSADEVRTCLLVAQSWGYLEGEHIAEALALVDRVLAMTYRLTRR